jgi:hypothetical protein
MPPSRATRSGTRLAIVLANWAVHDVNKAAQSSNRDTVLRQARKRLQEAARLDPDSSHARDNLATVEQILAGPVAPDPDEMADQIWDAIRWKVFPSPMRPNEWACKLLLANLVRTCSPKDVLPRFVSTVMANRSEYLEF